MKRVLREKKEKKSQKFMIYLVAIVMILSGAFIFERTSNPRGEPKKIQFEEYKVVDVGNGTILMTIERDTGSIIAMPLPNSVITTESLSDVLNSKIENVSEITYEVTDSFHLLRFKTTGEAINEIRNILDRTLIDYLLLKEYIGIIPNISTGFTSIYVIGNLELKKNDYVSVILMQKIVNEMPSDYMGFVESKILTGPIINATVKTIKGFYLNGVVSDNLDIDAIKNKIGNNTEVIHSQPKISVEESINLSEFNFSTRTENNKTEIIVDRSIKDIERVLADKNISSELEQGRISIIMPLNVSVDYVIEILDQNNITNITTNIVGTIGLPKYLIINDKVIRIQRNEEFPVVLKPTAKANEKVTVEVSTLQIGDQVIVYSAAQK